MVVIVAPATAPRAVMQERVARPSTWTVQAPHSPIPQPNLVPLRPISSRIAQSSGVSSGLRSETARPLRLNVIMIAPVQDIIVTRTLPPVGGQWQSSVPHRSKAGGPCGSDADRPRAALYRYR